MSDQKEILSSRRLKPYSKLSRKQQLRRLKAQRSKTDNCLSSSNVVSEEIILSETNVEFEALVQKISMSDEETGFQTTSNLLIEETIPSNNELESDEESEFWDKLNLYSDDEEEEEKEEVIAELTLWEKVANWALRNAKNRSSVNEILEIFRDSGHTNLPKDARTLLGTPRICSNIVPCGSGSYLHYGLQRALCELLHRIDQNIVPSNILLDINVDGLPLTRSSKSQLWPILGRISGLQYPDKVFLIGVYHGYEKPDSVDDLLNHFIEEYLELEKTGFTCNGIKYSVKINLIICDSPARSMITCTKGHNAHFGCPRCIDQGYHLNFRMCFLSTKSKLRTNQSFLLRKNEEYHIADSPLEKLEVKMIDQIPLDPMHLRDLGMGKKCIKFLISKMKKAGKLRGGDIKKLSETIISLRPYIPSEFTRKPRGLDEFDRWKAVECRLFLYYLGPLVFNTVATEEEAIHFNALHASLFILSHPVNYKENNECAEELLKWYVERFKTLYGEENLVFTIHCIQHLPKQTLINGTLDSHTAYPFENFMQTLKKMVRRQTNVLAQIYRRLVEMASTSKKLPQNLNSKKSEEFLKPYQADLPFGCTDAYQTVKFSNFELSINQPNNCCYLIDRNVIFIEHIAHKKGKPVIIGRRFVGISSFPNYPGDSQDLDLFLAEGLAELDIFALNQIDKKAVVLLADEKYYILPLMHTATS